MMTIEYPDGTKEIIEEPAPIHTYAAWKENGYQVKRGEKALAKFTIWKCAAAAAAAAAEAENEENADQERHTRMFQKLSFFFSGDQVEPIQARNEKTA